MVDINLLPEELREQEEKEKKAAKKKPRILEIKLTSPAKEAPEKKKKPKFGKKIFPKSRKKPVKPAAPPPILPPPSPPKARREEVKFELPEPPAKPPKTDTDLLAGGDIAEEKAAKVLKPLPKEKESKPFKEEPKPLSREEKVEISPPVVAPRPPKKRVNFWAKLKSIWAAFKFKPKKKIKAPKRVKPPPKKKPEKVKKPRLEINLIPEELARHPELELRNKFSILLLLSIITVFVILGLLQVVKWTRFETKDKIRAIEQKITDLKEKIQDLDNERVAALALRDRLSLIENLLARHLYWTKIFEALEKYTVDEVFYVNFAATEDGDLLIAAIGKDYNSVARQLVAFQEAKDFVRDVSITSATAEVSDTGEMQFVSFDINLQLVKETFLIKFESL